MGLTDKYPIDVKALHKGQLLTVDQLQHITGKKPTDQNAFAFALLALREFIQENSDFTVKLTVEGLRILTDAEAAEYNHRRFRGHLVGLARRHERNSVVDASELPEAAARQHAHDLLNESRYLTALTKTAKRITVEEHKRSLPAPNHRDPPAPAEGETED